MWKSILAGLLLAIIGSVGLGIICWFAYQGAQMLDQVKFVIE